MDAAQEAAMVEDLSTTFHRMDADGNGFLSFEEVMPAMREHFEGLTETQLESIIKVYDYDENGKIDYKEFIGFYKGINQNAESMRSKFYEMDTDSSGSLDLEELRALFLQFGVKSHMIECVFIMFDSNQDDKINGQEFEDFWYRKVLSEDLRKRKALLREFSKIDKDDNGYLSKEEVLPIVAKNFPGVDQKRIEGMVQHFDKDKSNQVNYVEFISFYKKIQERASQMSDKFDELDADKNGILDVEELRNTLADFCDMKPFMVDSVISTFDENKDGKISREEFNNLWVEMAKVR